MELLQSASLSLSHPSNLFIAATKKDKDSYFCHLKLQSVDEAKAFIKKFNGKRIDGNKKLNLSIEMFEKIDTLYREDLAKTLEDSTWLKITNLKPDTTDKALTQYIKKQTKVTPKCVYVQKWEMGSLPSYARVQIGNAKDTRKVMKQLQMSSFKGQKIWISQTESPKEKHRSEELRGINKKVFICNVPLSWNKPNEVEALCEKYGSVLKVEYLKNKDGYLNRIVLVNMSTVQEAGAVFDKLHGKKIDDCTLLTSFYTGLLSNCVWIYGFDRSVTSANIYEFVKGATNEVPLRIQIQDVGRARAATVAFSNIKTVQECLEKLDKTELNGETVSVRRSRGGLQYEAVKDSKCIRIDNLSREVTEQVLVTHLKEKVKIKKPPKEIRLVHHPKNNGQLGFAFVEFATSKLARSARDKVIQKNTTLHGKKLWAHPVPQADEDRRLSRRGETNTCILQNVHYKLDDGKIKKICAEYGEVTRVSRPSDRMGYPRPTVFVDMEDAKSAAKLFDALHGTVFEGLAIKTAFNKAERPNRSRDRVRGRGRGSYGKDVVRKGRFSESRFGGSAKMRGRNRGRSRGRGRGRRGGGKKYS